MIPALMEQREVKEVLVTVEAIRIYVASLSPARARW